MEVWSFINKKTNDIIRFDIRPGDSEFGPEYYFCDDIEILKYLAPWFVFSREAAELVYQTDIHIQYRINYDKPATDEIILSDYEIVCFELKNN